ncbi:hypoxia induced protein conserved region-domain-containing protein [Suillus paluster]|uniref:hypoxia induced protein conserved region-domain-containing protein n=1 Tax=Suillus paluster TaxID=48578 RepID=UPI001B85D45A|nr:hypoxia induced protein conserved region-domain-containing protein [Suillus paluster]KAG1740523.1 hypoxia induced protein conserved region-domain-containing protein [Suillus paluster]
MSTSPAAVPTTPSLHTGESYQEKAWRKFREQPLVPIGTLVTCSALIIAVVKMRRGDSQSLNNWLRVRVIAQGATIAAVCAGTYVMSSNAGDETKQTRQLDEIQAHRESRAGRERKEFEDRLKDAEKQWKETQEAVSGRDLNTNIAKGSFDLQSG